MSISIRHDPYEVAGKFRGIFAYGVETPAEARMLNISGQVGVPAGGPTPAGFSDQCRIALNHIKNILAEANMTFDDIVKMTFYLTRREDIPALLDVRMEMLNGVRPAVTTLLVAGLFEPDWLIEIDVVAAAS